MQDNNWCTNLTFTIKIQLMGDVARLAGLTFIKTSSYHVLEFILKLDI